MVDVTQPYDPMEGVIGDPLSGVLGTKATCLCGSRIECIEVLDEHHWVPTDGAPLKCQHGDGEHHPVKLRRWWDTPTFVDNVDYLIYLLGHTRVMRVHDPALTSRVKITIRYQVEPLEPVETIDDFSPDRVPLLDEVFTSMVEGTGFEEPVFFNASQPLDTNTHNSWVRLGNVIEVILTIREPDTRAPDIRVLATTATGDAG